MSNPNEQLKTFEKWYKQQWIKISIIYAVPDLLKQIKSYFF